MEAICKSILFLWGTIMSMQWHSLGRLLSGWVITPSPLTGTWDFWWESISLRGILLTMSEGPLSWPSLSLTTDVCLDWHMTSWHMTPWIDTWPLDTWPLIGPACSVYHATTPSNNARMECRSTNVMHTTAAVSREKQNFPFREITQLCHGQPLQHGFSTELLC